MSRSPLVLVRELVKSYRIAERDPGLAGAVRGLLRRRHRVVHALQGVSFRLGEGEMLGFIGPNGAGKSTTIKILSGILRPDSGEVLVDGRSPFEDRCRHVAAIGVVFGQRSQLWWDLPVRDGFDLLRDLYRIDESAYRRALDELVGLLRLGTLLDQPVRQLSLGQRMRAELAASLLHAPRLLFLDEPTIGLDAPSKLAVRGFVRRLNAERGVTVLLTTHDMHDVEALARRVIVIGSGRVLADAPFDALRDTVLAERRIDVRFQGEAPAVDLPGVEVVRREGSSLELRFDPARIGAPELLSRLATMRPIDDVHVQRAPIEDGIARLYDLHGAAEA